MNANKAVALLLAVALLFLSACAAPRTATDAPSALSERLRTNENLHSVLWVQTSVEYYAVARQSYQLAAVMMNRALADSTWTASLEQTRMENYRRLPPAVVLDVDETVLDNTPYQARLIEENRTYNRQSWNAWVREERAAPVPGAREFTRLAQAAGVQVFYLTNREHTLEAATRRNLKALGFPLDPEQDVILTRGERPGWDGSKESRRRAVAERYRILLLIGDNFGDFAAGADTSLRERQRLGGLYQKFWGTRWIVLPNPQYGSWEGALHGFEYSLSREEQLRRKYEQLRTNTPPPGR